ncbi:hypothetical protein HZI73_25865 [Vallitalea pronyensis]|uniref:Uncharacterized protein n=1 Tax=Vallitalea pronyensis TaxID=1348613 RepID=A0A8J8SJ18_9FIRM|nr:hypothetical protein [Vallitalea pronyensis]QUI25510.1 hypothetical protein HZI73_25865 [Vallitalea pronyensis]
MSNTGWDEMYPVTTAENVKCGDGSSVEAQLGDMANVIVATGIGTAITLSMPSVTAYSAYMKLTFIASANNSGGATTININNLGTKNLYKPNTTKAPNLKSGKPYTVWYDGTNFFLQASAEGNAVAGDVLAGKTFSNDDDTGVVGSMDLSNLISSNIKQGIDINGVVGSLIEGRRSATGSKNITTNSTLHTIYGLSFRPSVVLIALTEYPAHGEVVKIDSSNWSMSNDVLLWNRNDYPYISWQEINITDNGFTVKAYTEIGIVRPCIWLCIE